MDIKDAKLMGGIGSILILLSGIPKVGWVISLVGFVLVIIAIKKISEAVGREDAYSEYLKGAIINIVGVIIVSFVGVALIMGFLFKHAGGPQPPGPHIGGTIAFGAIIIFLIAWIIMIIGTYFIKNGLTYLSEGTGEEKFKTAGNLYFWGAILTVIVVGAILSLIGSIFQIIAFFSLPDTI